MKDNFQKIEMRMMAVFVIVIVGSSLVMMSILSHRSNENLKNYVSGLIAANGRQIELNLDTYLKKIEGNASLLFADNDFIEYDKAGDNSNLSDYAKIQMENALNDKIISLSLMDNFTDFAVIYSDDSKIGWISKNTSTLFQAGGMYDSFASIIDDDLVQDGWAFHCIDDFSRVYYTKRLNDNALILVSFYSTELDSAFVVPDALSDMTIRLSTEDYQIVYSTDINEIGNELPEKLVSLLEHKKDIQVAMDEDYLVTEHKCTNGWKVICSIPSDVLMRDNNVLFRNSVMLVLILIILGLCIGAVFYARFSRTMNSMVGQIKDKADNDQMTGLLNKMTFMSMVEQELSEYTGKQANCFIMIDIDNFKQINDRLGHAKGDEVIIAIAGILKKTFGTDMKIGRIGGDEFAVFASYTRIDRAHAEIYIRKVVNDVIREVAGSKLADLDISVSCGAVVAGPGEYIYDDLYKRADAMLYYSKQHGKGMAAFESDHKAAEGGCQ